MSVTQSIQIFFFSLANANNIYFFIRVIVHNSVPLTSWLRGGVHTLAIGQCDCACLCQLNCVPDKHSVARTLCLKRGLKAWVMWLSWILNTHFRCGLWKTNTLILSYKFNPVTSKWNHSLQPFTSDEPLAGWSGSVCTLLNTTMRPACNMQPVHPKLFSLKVIAFASPGRLTHHAILHLRLGSSRMTHVWVLL